MPSRREYLANMVSRYHKADSRREKVRLIDEVVNVLGYNRKYAIQVLNGQIPPIKTPRAKRKRPLRYLEALPAIQLVWEALDYPCAERLHPVLVPTAELLASHEELVLTPEVKEQLTQISRATLARRMSRWSCPKARRTLPKPRPENRLYQDIPPDTYAWDEGRPGALEADLVEHNGGCSLGQYAYTLSVVDVVSGYSRRRAVLGRGPTAIFVELKSIIDQWPITPWGLHSDNGNEFINNQLSRFSKHYGLTFTRSRPYRKNDNAHVEQKNRQYVREIVGYERYDTPEAVAWLNEVYALLDQYVNLFLPMRKVIAKTRLGSRVRKSYDTARTPVQRLFDTGTVDLPTRMAIEQQLKNLNPLKLHRELENLLAKGPSEVMPQPKSVAF